jgi:hypothetical protein
MHASVDYFKSPTQNQTITHKPTNLAKPIQDNAPSIERKAPPCLILSYLKPPASVYGWEVAFRWCQQLKYHKENRYRPQDIEVDSVGG